MKLHFNKIAVLCLFAGAALSSCSDFLYDESDLVIYDDEKTLNSDADTLWSVVGIFNKMQAVADRTVLLGEVRGDLVDIADGASADLQALATFDNTSANKYNSARDYYAIINNCNYFLAKADTDLKNNRNEYIFHKEYAAVKSFRAWTYLQLVLNYGRVPFIDKPILTQAQSEENYPLYDIHQVCQYFINDIAPYADEQMPDYGSIQGVASRQFYYPINVLLGDLCLWDGQYREAAQYYYRFLSTRNGVNSADPTTTSSVRFMAGDNRWMSTSDTWSSFFSKGGDETITLIPGDEFPREGYYSQLRDLFNTTPNNEYKRNIIPSQGIYDLSAAQHYCHYTGSEFVTPPALSDNRNGDLRLQSAVNTTKGMNITFNGKHITDFVSNAKQQSRHVNILRRSMVYLRMAEALCRAGFPRFAFQILKRGVNNNVIETEVVPYYAPEHAAWLRSFNFPNTSYVLETTATAMDENTMGLHGRGSGYTAYDVQYEMPDNEALTDSLSRLNYQIEAVEDLIVDEGALECAFEGQRYYDLMRVALRRSPNYLADRIYKRRGAAREAEMKALIKVDLTDKNNWYLKLN